MTYEMPADMLTYPHQQLLLYSTCEVVCCIKFAIIMCVSCLQSDEYRKVVAKNIILADIHAKHGSTRRVYVSYMLCVT